MSSEFFVTGNACTRVFTYTENGIHHEFTAPGGAALVARILSHKGLTAAELPDASYMREHLELERSGGGNKICYTAGRGMGITPGRTSYNTASAPYALLWNGEFETLPIGAGTPVLWAVNAGLPKREHLQAVADRCFLLLDADVLRAGGALISRRISWERTATELVWQLQNNPAISYLLAAKHILVTFAEDGAAYLSRGGGGLTAGLTLTHGGAEGTLRGERRIGDAFAIMAAAAALQVPDVLDGKRELRVSPILESAAELMRAGYEIERLKSCDYALFDADTAIKNTVFSIPIKPGQNAADPDRWCISNNVGERRIFDIAYDYVLEGSAAIEGLPKLSFGGLTTIDRWEIEAFGNIRNLIVGYAEDKNVKPLSIAVFGSPGSGKSFGVTQIAKNVLPGVIEKLEFNVSQFSGSGDLGAAFQRVRDVILEGRLPLVFFDEFDSDRDGMPLGWIKSFLMPMQDGKFKDESGEHPLGKCILVFAGGTASSFEEFSAPMLSDDPDVRQTFKNIKGPDFVSRLRGTINVLGPNPSGEGDRNYILRRALLLRSLCERKLDMKSACAPISPNVLWAMLLVPRYEHGARSMEAILDMSRIEGAVWEPVSLPFYSQLSLHVDADAFIRLVLREVVLGSYTEQLAQAIHVDYLAKLLAAGNETHPSAVSWDELPEDMRESNRAQARDISEKLKTVGYAFDAGDTPFPTVTAFDEETTLLLAMGEHSRWCTERLAAGWKYGSLRDNGKKLHPSLISWEELPLDERQKDIDAARNIIPLLKGIGLRVYRTV